MCVIKRKFIFETIISGISWTVFLISLIRMCAVYNALPNEIGVHFAADGSFDVIADKRFAWYPHVVSFISLLIFELFAVLTGKIRAGFKVTEVGEEKIKIALLVFLNTIKICTVLFFSCIWADCVIRQRSLNTTVAQVIAIFYLFSIIVFILGVILIRIIYRLKNTGMKKADYS